jgi:hypothetical protein
MSLIPALIANGWMVGSSRHRSWSKPSRSSTSSENARCFSIGKSPRSEESSTRSAFSPIWAISGTSSRFSSSKTTRTSSAVMPSSKSSSSTSYSLSKPMPSKHSV